MNQEGENDVVTGQRPEAKFDLTSIATQVKGISTTKDLVADLVDKLAENEHNKNLETLTKGYQLYKDATHAFNKASKPDIKYYDSEEKPLEVFSEEARKKKNEAKEKLTKITNAMTKALVDKDFSKLNDMVK